MTTETQKTPINDGGPAFAAPQNGPDGCCQWGMSLRDWFAGQALAGIMPDFSNNSLAPGDCAVIAYAIADAMIAAREKRTK